MPFEEDGVSQMCGRPHTPQRISKQVVLLCDFAGGCSLRPCLQNLSFHIPVGLLIHAASARCFSSIHSTDAKHWVRSWGFSAR